MAEKPRHSVSFPIACPRIYFSNPARPLTRSRFGRRSRLFFKAETVLPYKPFIYTITLIIIHTVHLYPSHHLSPIIDPLSQWQRPTIESLLWPMFRTVSQHKHTHTIEHITDYYRQDSFISICLVQGSSLRHHFFLTRSPGRR